MTDGSGKMPIHYMTAATPVSAVRAVIHIEGRMIRGCERRHKDLSQKEVSVFLWCSSTFLWIPNSASKQTDSQLMNH